MNLIVKQDLFTGLLLFDHHNMVVKFNQKIELKCGITTDYHYCIWEKDNDIIQVKIQHIILTMWCMGEAEMFVGV